MKLLTLTSLMPYLKCSAEDMSASFENYVSRPWRFIKTKSQLFASRRPRLTIPYPAHAPHDAVLLRVDEALQHDADGHVDVVLLYVVPQVHLGVGLGHADHGLDVPHRDWDAAGRLRQVGTSS